MPSDELVRAALAYCAARRKSRRAYDELVDAEEADVGYVTARTARARLDMEAAIHAEAVLWDAYLGEIHKESRDE